MSVYGFNHHTDGGSGSVVTCSGSGLSGAGDGNAGLCPQNGFQGALLGLSGGIDSGLTVAIAADALGKDKVQAVMMPFRYTSDISIHDAREQAELLGVEFDVVSIEPMFEAFMHELAPKFAGTPVDTTEENLQARCRAVILMAMSNKRRRIVLTTSNKSECAVGYSTLYGDMAGL